MTRAILGQVTAGEDLTKETMAHVMGEVMRGEWQEAEIGLLLTALRTKGETVDEVAGAAQALRSCMTKIPGDPTRLIDTCGTGGGGTGTFNISTAAALVAAAAGARVAKHGNRSITSKTGSADALAALGVNMDASVSQVARCLEEVGICFCFAPLLHPAMKHVANVRRQLGVPTIFNILGPLCNPASAPYQLLGAGRPTLRPLLAAAMARLGTQRAVVVHGEDGLGEVTTEGPTDVSEVTPQRIHEFRWTPEMFRVQPSDKSAMLVDGPAASAAVIRAVLEGTPGPCLEIVVLNAAAALWTADIEPSLPNAAQRCRDAITTGAAKQTLSRLAECSHREAG